MIDDYMQLMSEIFNNPVKLIINGEHIGNHYNEFVMDSGKRIVFKFLKNKIHFSKYVNSALVQEGLVIEKRNNRKEIYDLMHTALSKNHDKIIRK